MANRYGAVLTVLAMLAGCGHRDDPPPVGEQIDPSERYLVPSIVASARRLVDKVQKESGPLYRRDAHAKAHGCLTATFTVREDLPEAMRTGVFVPGHQYQAWIRFSNGNAELQPDYDKDARGMAIKLMGVEGPKLLDSPADKDAQTQDFLMINHPVFFNRDPAEYERFIRYQADGSQFGYFFAGRNPLDWRWRELIIGGQLLGRIRNIAVPEIERSFQAANIVAQVEGIKEVATQAATQVQGIIDQVKPANAAEAAALEALKPMVADKKITADETLRVSQLLGTLDVAIRTQMGTAAANTDKLIQTIATMQRRLDAQQKHIGQLQSSARGSGN